MYRIFKANGVASVYSSPSQAVDDASLHLAAQHAKRAGATIVDARNPYKCIPDALREKYWGVSENVAADTGGRAVTGNVLESYDKQRLCECINAADPDSVYAKGGFSGYLSGAARSQERVDSCWNNIFFGGLPKVGGGWMFATERQESVVFPQYRTPRWSKPYYVGLPNPCYSMEGMPAPCSIAESFAKSHSSRGQPADFIRAEREPVRNLWHPVDVHRHDFGAEHVLPSGEVRQPIQVDLTGGTSLNVPYLTALKARREEVRRTEPLSGLGEAPGIPSDAVRKKNLMIAGVVGGAALFGGIVHMLSRKK
jgi:hypothetical protein